MLFLVRRQSVPWRNHCGKGNGQHLKKSFTCKFFVNVNAFCNFRWAFFTNFNFVEGDIMTIFLELKTGKGRTFFYVTKFVNQIVIHKTLVLVILINTFSS